MNNQNFIAVLIHGQLGETLTKVFNRDASENPFTIDPGNNNTLVEQLEQDGDNLPRIGFRIVLDIFPASVSTLLAAPSAAAAGLPALLERARNALGGQAGLFDKQGDAIAKLIDARNPEGLREAAEGLFRGVLDVFQGPGGSDGPTSGCVQRLQQFFGNDIGTVLPFATIVNAVPRALQDVVQIPQSIEKGLLAYFFQPKGYKTVDGESVVAPVHLSDIGGAVARAAGGADLGGLQLRGLFSKTTAERYLRDITRIMVESAFDAGRELKERYRRTESDLKNLKSTEKDQAAIVEKFVAWLRGFASMAESASMRAVEVGTQGVSEFQTNPLIAAAAGSFAGTVARKLAQDSFLGVLRNELNNRAKKSP
jgi:hypothetical protein